MSASKPRGKVSWVSIFPRYLCGFNMWSIVPLVALIISVVSAKKEYDNNGGKSRLVTNMEWTRRRVKSSECRLGGARYALNSTWSPNLGPPFGVWNCVKCTCTPVRKKRRIVAKVICRNMKTDCPTDPKCENPVIYPGGCCKVCPGEGGKGSSSPTEIGILQEEEVETTSPSGKDFAVLLNGRTSLSPLTSRRLATGRVFLRRGTLHFSFVVDALTPAPTTVQFLSEDGNILEELEAQPTPYEVNNGRICGTWTRVPRQYRNLLLSEKMWVALLSDSDEDDDPISGRIARYKGVSTEVFSALLSPQKETNRTLPSGGTAIISVSAPSDSLHVSLVFNGLFRSNDERNVSLFVELRPSRSLDPVRDIILLEKVFSDVNEAEVRTTLGDTSLRLLTRGKVKMRIWSSSAPEFALEGAITSRATCNVFHSVVTAFPEGSFPPYSAGWGLLFISNEGDFEYQVRLENLPPGEVAEVVLQTATRRRVRHVEDLTPAFFNGWVNGTYGKPTYRDLDSLLRGRLKVNVVLRQGWILEGTFESVSVTEALRSLHPVLLTTPTSWLAATAWVAVDDDCVMHYDVHLAGKDPAGGYDPTWSLQLRENDTSWDPRLDLANVTLEHIISGREVAAHTTLLTKVSLSRLHHGVSYLDLTVASSSSSFASSTILTGRLDNVAVPSLCLLESDMVGIGKKPEMGVQVDAPCKGFVCLDEEVKPVISKKCIDDDKKVYEDGTTWKSPLNNCARCMCTLGKITCQTEPCPKPTCADAVLLPGQCCSSCPVVSGRESERVCKMGDDFHIIGAFWHPFLAPNGFDKCVTCYCNVGWKSSPIVECNRVACPQLNCFESEASFLDNACCPSCPATTLAPRRTFSVTVKGMVNEDVRIMSDQRKREEVLADGGCLERKKFLRPNGDVWYPRLSPNGVQRCVSCTCKDGNISCVGLKCSRNDCPKGKKCRKRKKPHKEKTFSKYNNSLHRRRKNRRKLEKKRLGFGLQ